MGKSDYLEMKKKAMRYYQENQVPQQLERLLNKMFVENPDDIYGYLSEFFAQLAKPVTIAEIAFQPSINLRGHENMTASVSCCVNGVTKHVLDLPSVNDNSPVKTQVTARMKSASEKAPKKKGNKKDTGSVLALPMESCVKVVESVESFQERSSVFQQHFIPLLKGCGISDQGNVDKLLKSLVETLINELNPKLVSPMPYINENESVGEKSESDHGVHTLCDEAEKSSKATINQSSFFSSQIVAMVAAQINKLPLYQSLKMTLGIKESDRYFLPTPAVSIISCDPSSAGKLMMFKDLMIAPKPLMDVEQGINMIVKLISCVEQALFSKFGAAGVFKNADGVFSPPFDKPEPALDFLIETAQSEMKIEFAEVFDIIINIDAHQLYDEEKVKYDVIIGGSSKSAEELVAMYNKWAELYPVIAIVNGLCEKNGEKLLMMLKEISRQCAIFCDDTKENVTVKITEEERFSGIFVHPEKSFSTLTDLFSFATSAKEMGCQMMIADDLCGLQNSAAVVDMAVALDAPYLRISAPSSYGNLALARLLCVYYELKNGEKLIESRTFLTEKLQELTIVEGDS